MTDKKAERTEEQARIDAFMKHYSGLPTEEQNKIRHSMERAADAFFDGDLTTPDIFYLDLDFLRDSRIGTIMTFALERPNPEEAYHQVRAGLKDYQLRLYDEITPFFPALGITEEQYLERRNDPAWADRIFDHAPSTQYVYTIQEKLRHNANHSQVAERWKKKYLDHSKTQYTRQYDSVHFFVNTWPLQLSKERTASIGLFLTQTFKVDVTCINVDPKTMPFSLFRKFEEITTFYLKEFMDNEPLREQICHQTFTNNYFFAPLILPKQETAGAQFKRELSILTDAMRLYYNFQWLHSARFCCDISLYEIPDKTDDEVSKAFPPIVE